LLQEIPNKGEDVIPALVKFCVVSLDLFRDDLEENGAMTSSLFDEPLGAPEKIYKISP